MNESKTSLKKVAFDYVKFLGLKITESSLHKALEENTNYPSVLCLTETFRKFRINSAAFNASFDQLKEVETPFIAFLAIPDTGSDFVLITKMTETNVTYLYKNRKPEVVSVADFAARFLRIIWIAEPDDQSGELHYFENLAKEKIIKRKKITWFFLVAMLLFATWGVNIYHSNILSFSLIVLIKFIGIFFTILILVYELDGNNALVKDICTAKKQTSCEVVLNSKASKIFGISWGEIGFFYFASTTFWLLFPLLDFKSKIYLLACSNAIAVPYVLFSVYYQWRIAKKWCPLCLSVQGVLLFELVWNIFNFWTLPHQTFSDYFTNTSTITIVIGLAIVMFVVLFWYGLKYFINKSSRASSYYFAFKQLQYNPEVFQALLEKRPQIVDGWQNIGIDIGNPNAKNKIIEVCSPYCGPCARAHIQLDELIRLNDDINLKIIFTTTNDTSDQGLPVIQQLLSVASEDNRTKTQNYLRDWYALSEKNFEKFSKKYPGIDMIDSEHKIGSMSKWCDMAKISFTPTIFINGYLMPENYVAEDLSKIY